MTAGLHAVLALACVTVAVGAVAEPASVHRQADRLSVRAEKASRADLLREVARQTHIEIDGLALVTGEVTLHVSAVPLDAALTMIADDGGHALVRRVSGRRSHYAVYIVGRNPEGARLPRPTATARPAGTPTSAPPPSVPAPLAGQPPQSSGVTVTEEGG